MSYINTPFGHCIGCRCFVNVWPSTGTIHITTPYVPRHRKPGPAQ